MAESHREEIAKLEALYAGNPGGRVFVHLAEAYRKAGEHERARRILDEGLSRHPDSASGYVVLGRVLADMQITTEAEVAFHRVLELDAGNLIALRWLGDLARQSGRNEEAATHYRELLVRNPSNEEVRDLVEIVEREAGGAALAAAGEADAETPADAFAGLDTRPAHDEPALAGSAGESEKAALTPPAPAADAAQPDVTPWAAAPGQTGDAVQPPVEFGLVDLDTAAVDEEMASDRQAAPPEPVRAEDESDVVAAIDEDDDVLELDELRRDDEAEPLEIHLLDPAYEPAEDEDADDFAGELDLSDLAASGTLEDEGDYADEIFVADLAAAAGEEPEPDELPGGVDVMGAGAALTLLPEDEGGSGTQANDAATAQDTTAAAGADAAAGVAAPADDAWSDAVTEPAFTFAPDDEQADAAAGVEAPPVAEDLSEAGLTALAGAAEPAAEAIPGTEEETPLADAAPFAEEGAVAGAAPVGEAESAAAVEPAGEAEPAAAERAPEAAPDAEVRRGGDSGLVTETMAVLYRSQGFHDRAADVYRSLLRSRPGDERLAAKLREAEEAAGSPARPAADEDAGEVWLRGVGAAWTGPGDESTADATPYAWTEPEEGEAGEPIGSYLHDLVSWKAGSGAWLQPGTGEETEPGGEIDVPEWMNGPDAAAWTPESEPRGYPALPAAESDWSAPPAEPDPWDVTAEPQEGAGAPPTDGPMDEWALPADLPGSPSAQDSDAEGGWTPLELEDDVPPAAASAGPAAPHASRGQTEEDSSDDDDDLEMFRSWLQSLKK